MWLHLAQRRKGGGYEIGGDILYILASYLLPCLLVGALHGLKLLSAAAFAVGGGLRTQALVGVLDADQIGLARREAEHGAPVLCGGR